MSRTGVASPDLSTRQDAVKDDLVRQFAERIDGLTLAADIDWNGIRFIVDNLVHELERTRIVVRDRPA